MTREEAKQWIPLLQAYADGAEIEIMDNPFLPNFEKLEIGQYFQHLFNDVTAVSDGYRIKPQDHSKCVKEWF